MRILKLFFVILLLSFSLSNFCYGDIWEVLKIKKIITDQNEAKIEGYQPGKKTYPEYKRGGLPDDFLIKIEPDIILRDDDIRSIRINGHHFDRMSFSESCGVSMFFSKIGSAKIGEYGLHPVNWTAKREVLG